VSDSEHPVKLSELLMKLSSFPHSTTRKVVFKSIFSMSEFIHLLRLEEV